MVGVRTNFLSFRSFLSTLITELKCRSLVLQSSNLVPDRSRPAKDIFMYIYIGLYTVYFLNDFDMFYCFCSCFLFRKQLWHGFLRMDTQTQTCTLAHSHTFECKHPGTQFLWEMRKSLCSARFTVSTTHKLFHNCVFWISLMANRTKSKKTSREKNANERKTENQPPLIVMCAKKLTRSPPFPSESKQWWRNANGSKCVTIS